MTLYLYSNPILSFCVVRYFPCFYKSSYLSWNDLLFLYLRAVDEFKADGASSKPGELMGEEVGILHLLRLASRMTPLPWISPEGGPVHQEGGLVLENERPWKTWRPGTGPLLVTRNGCFPKCHTLVSRGSCCPVKTFLKLLLLRKHSTVLGFWFIWGGGRTLWSSKTPPKSPLGVPSNHLRSLWGCLEEPPLCWECH